MTMYVTYENLYEICVPKYYTDENQFIYLLAITPFSKWNELLMTYKQIGDFKKQKSELYDTLS
jgi:hypothetical protein